MKRLYSDGYTIHKNPSDVGGGYVVMDEFEQILASVEVLKKGMTNNEAELLGVLKATELAMEGDTIITDSMNTLAWVLSPKRKIKARPDLKPQADLAYYNIQTKNLKLIQEPRETNLAGNYIEFTLQQNWENKFK